ncbi:MAG: hypothetical protein KatS3mg081_2591 [Gemmatimonadales bacterium]|nr:MAG: hypothetical protein KatS3mg081_2591 [Gemmatimonadales bacterium]
MAVSGIGSRKRKMYWLAVAVVVVAGFCVPMQGRGQDVPAVLSRANQAYEQGNFEEAAKLFSYSLNPEFNLPDSVWTLTLQRLAHSLLEVGRADLAGVWLRWALRHRGSVDVDDINFPPAVIRAFAEASRDVDQTPDSLAIAVAETVWHWPAEPQELVALGGILVPVSLQPERGACNESGMVVGAGRRVNWGPCR